MSPRMYFLRPPFAPLALPVSASLRTFFFQIVYLLLKFTISFTVLTVFLRGAASTLRLPPRSPFADQMASQMSPPPLLLLPKGLLGNAEILPNPTKALPASSPPGENYTYD